MKIFWVIKAKTALFVLVACFAVLLVIYSWNYAASEVFLWKNKHVLFMGTELDPRAPDLEEQVKRLTETLNQVAVPAEYDSVNESVIPDVHGFEIDTGKTTDKIRSAKKGENVVPVWREVCAESTLKDFAELPIYQGNPLKNQVALVVNVSWGNEYLEEILTLLGEENVSATFFLVGRWAEENPNLVKKIHDQGHDLGNHGFSDPHMKDLSTDQIRDEITRCNQVVNGLTGQTVGWFSPPYGEKEEKIYSAAAELGLHTVLWSLDTIDWTLPGEETIVQRIVPNLHNGAVILMHPTEQTPGALVQIIEGIKEKNLQIVTVSELLNPSYWPQKYNSLWLGK